MVYDKKSCSLAVKCIVSCMVAHMAGTLQCGVLYKLCLPHRLVIIPLQNMAEA